MIYNLRYHTRPLLAHAPGKIQYIPLWHQMLALTTNITINTKISYNVSIVTFNNGGSGHNDKPLGLFEQQICKAGVHVNVLGGKIIDWRNSIKIQLLKDFLCSTDCEYILVADSSDVFLTGKLDKLVKLFEEFHCDAVFNCENQFWPIDMIRLKVFEEQIHFGAYLNAGLWMARRSFAVELIDDCCKLTVPINYRNSEQIHYKLLYPKYYPRMRIDITSKLFQGLNRTSDQDIRLVKIF